MIAGMSKDRITTAIERGQGRSATGAALQPLLISAMVPRNVALLIDCAAENKLRALQDVKSVLTKHNAQLTPADYLFSKKGIIRIAAGSGGHGFSDVMMTALEIDGTEDVREVDDVQARLSGGVATPEFVIITDPARTGVVAQEVKNKLVGLQISTYGIEWVPNEDTKVEVTETKAEELCDILEKLEDISDVNKVYTNIKD
jgi:transcriptional/translational regulatory protein YebC/TACO1